MILKREVTAGIRVFGRSSKCFCSTPSRRKRTSRLRSCGSTWMSLAPHSMASTRMRSTRLTTGEALAMVGLEASRSSISLISCSPLEPLGMSRSSMIERTCWAAGWGSGGRWTAWPSAWSSAWSSPLASPGSGAVARLSSAATMSWPRARCNSARRPVGPSSASRAWRC